MLSFDGVLDNTLLFYSTLVAALHFNENIARKQRTTAYGDAMYSLHYPKYKAGGHIVRKVLVDPTYGKN